MTTKEPMHPGKILKIITDENHVGWISAGLNPLEAIHNMTYINECDLKKLLNCEIDIDYPIAYKLGARIGGTDMAFWLKLQKDYDDYVESSIKKDMDESISQLDEYCRVFGTAHFPADEKKLSEAKVIEIIKDYVLPRCENADCYGCEAFCLENDHLLEIAKEIIKLFEPESSNKKESIKSAISSAKSFLDRALTESESEDNQENKKCEYPSYILDELKNVNEKLDGFIKDFFRVFEYIKLGEKGSIPYYNVSKELESFKYKYYDGIFP